MSECDYIYTMNSGLITEHGTYAQLLSNAGEFARLDKAFGGTETETTEGAAEEAIGTPVNLSIEKIKDKSTRNAGSGKLEGRLIVRYQTEIF